MAGGGQIAEFFGTLGFKINQADIKKFDKTLDNLEARAKRFSEGSLSNLKVRISGFEFAPDFNRKLNTALRWRMRQVTRQGSGVTPKINIDKFDFDRNEMLREAKDAVRYVENNLRMNIRSSVQQPAGGFTGSQGFRTGMGAGAGAAAGASLGGKASVFARGIMPGFGLGWAVGQLNAINQQLIGIENAATAVFGGEEEGIAGMRWLKQFSSEAGLHYRKQAPVYQKMIASATSVGVDVEEAQGMFAGVTRYGRSLGLDSQTMQGSMRA